MKLSVPERFEDFEEGFDMDHWFQFAIDEMEGYIDGRGTPQPTKEQLAAMFLSFEKIMHAADAAGIEDLRAWEMAGWQSTNPRQRYEYFARAYKLQIKENEEKESGDAESVAWPYYNLAEYAHEVGRIHEGDGEMKKAAECYERSLRHLQEAADACDAQINLRTPGEPRRPRFEASLERVRKFLK